MSFPKSGKSFHGNADRSVGVTLADVVQAGLRREAQGQSSVAKIVAGWTGANERTVKYWLAGQTAPAGDHFLRIAANSPAVLAAFLSAIGRTDCLTSLDVMRAREALKAALDSIDGAMGSPSDTSFAG